MPDASNRYLLAAVAALAFMVCGTPGSAADAGRGRQLAGRVCSVCHVVTAGQQPGVPNAPSFQSIARSPQFRAKRAKLLWEKHGTMPNFALTAEEAEDVTAYIRSLAR
jgi:mono/diheme cytochrome c family protein